MKGYPLEGMVPVRALREEQASRALRERLTELDRALQEWEAAKETARECRLARRRKEDEGQAALVGAQRPTGDARALMRELASWQARIDEAEAAAAAAAKAVDAAREACESARAAYVARSKERLKIGSHRDAWAIQACREAEAAEERELEDSHARKPDSRRIS